MTEFDKSNWAKPEFSQEYRDNADIFIVERRRMLAILQSFYRHFIADGTVKNVCDLGCGDGIVTAAIADINASLSVTLVDGSAEMLAKARERLGKLRNVAFIQACFQEIIGNDHAIGAYDFIASSLAIHHLAPEKKVKLYHYVHDHLKPGGYFINIDVVQAPFDPLEQWYLALWHDWISERQSALGIEGDRFDSIPEGYKNNIDNKPDTLQFQLDALRNVGFQNVDCYYKYGIFTMFGGRR
jgi:tRNA (cmo5U34)-methyltransferase